MRGWRRGCRQDLADKFRNLVGNLLGGGFSEERSMVHPPNPLRRKWDRRR